MGATGKTAKNPSLDELLDAAVAVVPGGTRREGQHTMAHAVAEAARTGEHLLIQAGTGTGKSLAYLVPALHSRRRVVVSTATLALQAQLVESDLPRLADAVTPLLGRRPTYALLKGRHHYLCLARLDGASAEDQGDALFDDGPKWLAQAGRLGQQMTRIREWADKTEHGDRTELDPGVDDTVWRTVSMPARECIGAQRCPFGEECYAEASRARARAADIVVTNHSLLAVDMVAARQILPEHDLLVVDEAHELVDRVTSATQAELSGETVTRAARRVRSEVDAAAYDRLEEAGELLRITLDGTPVGRLTALPAGLREALTLLDAACRTVLDSIGNVSTDDPDAVAIAGAKATVDGLSDTAQRLLTESEHDVAWTTGDERGRRTLAVAPLSVAAQLGGGLYRNRAVVATSATLALGGRFDLVARSLGLDPRYGRTPANSDTRPEEPPAPADDDSSDEEQGPQAWRALDVGSPFDYARQGVLYVAARLPRPGMSGLSDAAQEELVALAEAAGGRTLGLFSSRKAAGQAAEVLRARTSLPVLVQGEDTLGHLVRRFREDPQACLLGVMSLWQGVDVPGPACQLVVIDRLPFPRPDDPLSSARSKAVDESGGSGFASVSVPHAAVRLAQGAGRLVRSAGDRGVVAVLDSRLHTARYGDFLRRSLPPFWYTTQRDVVLAALGRLDATAREAQTAAG
ncbi:MAG TPA: ATP-dependent DNA helicase [Mycobacteriales bacterium]